MLPRTLVIRSPPCAFQSSTAFESIFVKLSHDVLHRSINDDFSISDPTSLFVGESNGTEGSITANSSFSLIN